MPSGQRFQGVDFDDLFDPDITGDGPVANSYRRPGGAPLRYAHIQYGARRGDVGRRQGGQDLAALWAAKGTASYSLPINGQWFNASNQARSNSTGPTSATVTLILDSNGTYRVQSNAAGGGNASSGDVATGTWLASGASAGEYEVQFEVSGSGPASIGNSAPNYANCGTTRTVGATVSVPSASAQYLSQDVGILIRLRRSNGAVSTTQIYFRVSASGWY